jgi:hypothetical protein
MKRLSLDEVEGIPVFGSLVWKPVRKTLGVTAFGINAYTAANAGDEVVEDHTESQLGHEEIYAVVTGRATFTVDGEEVDAPAGTLVYLDDPARRLLEEALTEKDAPVVHYQLACVEALSGNKERARRAEARDRRRGTLPRARREGRGLRLDPRFPA